MRYAFIVIFLNNNMSTVFEKVTVPKPQRKYTIAFEKQLDGGYSGQCLELPSAISEGKTMEQLELNMREAIQLVEEFIEEKSQTKQVLEILA